MQALKFLITILTLLIVIAVTVIAYGMYRKSVDPDFKFFELGSSNKTLERSQLPSSPTSTEGQKNEVFQPSVFGEVLLSLPRGCSISTVSGVGNRLFLKIGPSERKCERVIIVNSTNGAILGTIRVSQ